MNAVCLRSRPICVRLAHTYAKGGFGPLRSNQPWSLSTHKESEAPADATQSFYSHFEGKDMEEKTLTHIPVMLSEVLDVLSLRSGQTVNFE